MKRFAYVLIAGFTLFTSALAFAQSDAQKSFSQIKSLAGEWEGKNSAGEPVQVSYKITSGGSAVMSEIGARSEDMISMFHLDGRDKLMLTHYCAVGNQPRMLATSSSDGKTVRFNFLDATNLASLDAGHMQSVTIAMLDANHHTEEWTFSDHGNTHKEVFDLHRK